MADGNIPRKDELDTQEIGASSANPADIVTPEKAPEQMNAEADKLAAALAKALQEHDDARELDATQKQQAKQAQQMQLMATRMKYYYEQFGYSGNPDPRSFGLIGGIESQKGQMITILQDGKTAIIDNGKSMKLNTPEFTDDAGQVLASQILAKGWDTIKLTGSRENREKLAAHILAQDPSAKIKGIDPTSPHIQKYAAMLQETRGLGQQPRTPETQAPALEIQQPASVHNVEPVVPKNEQQTAPAQKSMLIVPEQTGSKEKYPHTPTRDYPVAGTVQRDFESFVADHAHDLEERRLFDHKMGKEPSITLTREQKASNELLECIQNASPEKHDAYRNLMVAASKELKGATPEERTKVIFKAHALSTEIENAFTANVAPEQKRKVANTRQEARPSAGL